MITHSATDEEYTDNLRFLIKHGMGGQDGSVREYIIIVQQACPTALFTRVADDAGLKLLFMQG